MAVVSSLPEGERALVLRLKKLKNIFGSFLKYLSNPVPGGQPPEYVPQLSRVAQAVGEVGRYVVVLLLLLRML